MLAGVVYVTLLLSQATGGESLTLRAVGPVLSNSMFMVLPFITHRRSCRGHKHTEISSCALSTANWCLGTIPLVGIQLFAGRPEEQGQFQLLLLFLFSFYCTTTKQALKWILATARFSLTKRKLTKKKSCTITELCECVNSYVFINRWQCPQRDHYTLRFV